MKTVSNFKKNVKLTSPFGGTTVDDEVVETLLVLGPDVVAADVLVYGIVVAYIVVLFKVVGTAVDGTDVEEPEVLVSIVVRLGVVGSDVVEDELVARGVVGPAIVRANVVESKVGSTLIGLVAFGVDVVVPVDVEVPIVGSRVLWFEVGTTVIVARTSVAESLKTKELWITGLGKTNLI